MPPTDRPKPPGPLVIPFPDRMAVNPTSGRLPTSAPIPPDPQPDTPRRIANVRDAQDAARVLIIGLGWCVAFAVGVFVGRWA